MSETPPSVTPPNLDHRAAVTPFRVYARVRPFIPEELEAMTNTGTGQLELRSIIEMRGKSTYLLDPKNDYQPKLQFEFDGSWWSIPASMPIPITFHDQEEHRVFVSQAEVYKIVGASCVEDVVEGYNSCIMSYGQTGSGKTYTMMGNYEVEEERGVISRLCHDLFDKVRALRAASAAAPNQEGVVKPSYIVEVNFVEVYMEKVRDLLDPNLARKHSAVAHDDDHGKHTESRVRQHPVSGPYVEGVTKYTVETWDDCCKLLERGSRQRRTCANVVHNQSSRSHAIFQITLLQEIIMPRKDKYSEPVVKRKAGRINLVDLAGSERGGATDYVKESAMINKSLLALRRVIDTLTARQTMIFEEANAELQGKEYVEKTKPQVPFRDSVLTWVLSDSIGGNAKTVMIATVSPYSTYFLDTLATLQWSHKARSLVTVVKANDMTSNKVIKNMKGHVEQLNIQLSSQQQNVDNIRQELQRRQIMGENIERQNEELLRRIQETGGLDEGQKQSNAAISIQLAFRMHSMRHRLKLKSDALKRYQESHATIVKETRDVVAKADAATQELASADERKAKLQDKIDSLRAKLVMTSKEEEGGPVDKGASLDDQRIIAKKLAAAAVARSKEHSKKLASAQEARTTQNDEVSKKIASTKAEIAKVTKSTAALDKKMETNAEDAKTEKERLEAEIAQLRTRIQMQDEMIPTLRLKQTEVRTERELLTQQCDLLEMKNAKKAKRPIAKKPKT
jgi:septal ring factor EnvC (AmiA/AmiB activator)